MKYLHSAMVTLGMMMVLPPALHADPASSADRLDSVQEFLQKNVIGRRLKLVSNPCAQPIAGTHITCEFERINYFSGLKRGASSLEFQRTWVVKQTNHMPQTDGTVRDENKDRTGTSHCMIHASLSLGMPDALFGICTPVVSTLLDTVGLGSSIIVSLKGDKLEMETSTINFADCFADQGYQACSSKDKTELQIIDGKLHQSARSQNYRVIDPLTNQTEPMGDLETYLDEEI